jgi:phosphohistidine phosphatase
MRLLLIRHADAGDPDAGRWRDDRERPLTPLGEREHATMAAALARLDLGVARVLSSPLVRARQTAEITARALGVVDVTLVPALGDRFVQDDVLAELGALASAKAVACVGHEPSISSFAATLLHGDGHVRVAFAKGAVMALDCPGPPAPGGARLLFFWSPRELQRMLDARD